MERREHRFSPMDTFSPTHQPDEGYSEEPINPAPRHDLPSILATLKSPDDLPSWLAANANLLPVHMKTELTMALLDGLPTATISEIVERLNPRLYINFIQHLPAEICLKILGYLDPVSLVRMLQTCRSSYDLASDHKLWENLYYLEGWKAVESEMSTWESRVNIGLSASVGHLHRIQSSEGHVSKVRPVADDDDYDMLDSSRFPSIGDSNNITESPQTSFSSSRTMPNMDMDSTGSRSMSSTRGKRKEPGGVPETTPLPPILPPDDPCVMLRSTLWMWDVNSTRYRINWKYIYKMRRRLESNWENGRYSTFMLPHPSYPDEGHQECIYTIQFDSQWIVSGSRDQTMRVWNLRTRRLARPPLAGHHGSVLCLQFDADPEEDLLVSGSSDSNVFIWKFSTGQVIQRITRAHRESVLNVRFDKRILVTSSKDKSIKIFNRRPLRYGDVGYRVDTVVNPVARSVKNYAMEPDIALDLPVKPPFTMIGRLEGHTAAVNAIQVRDQTIVSVSGDRHIKVWKWPEQACIQTIPAHAKGIACVEYDGRRIVSGSSDHDVAIFDAPTGLKVAQLRGHTGLVRTVQAGFADLPYSAEDDEATARAVDRQYFRAVEAGEVDHDGRRQSRQVNAGSAQPEDIQTFGAKVPPGGGGGRRYGRIVSGSYDHTIIIWRRDNEGIWRPGRTLRQEEAAAAAQREALPILPRAGPPILDNLPPISMHSTGPHVPQQLMQLWNLPLSVNANQDPAYATPFIWRSLIDQAVPLGSGALQQALAYHPGMLVHHAYLQNAIDREPSPFVRSQLRHVVMNAILTIRNNQAAMSNLQVQQNTAAPTPGGTSSMGADAGSLATTQAPTPIDGNPVGQENTASPTNTVNAPAGGMPPPTPAPAGNEGVVPPAQEPNANNNNAAAQAPQGGGAAHNNNHHHHPHIAGDNPQARVFKLQFDARRIVCCTQAPVIVGWDFCNEDPELEEATRFFATVD